MRLSLATMPATQLSVLGEGKERRGEGLGARQVRSRGAKGGRWVDDREVGVQPATQRVFSSPRPHLGTPNSPTRLTGEGHGCVAQQADGVQQVLDQHGLEHVELKVAVGAAHGDGHVVAHHLQCE